MHEPIDDTERRIRIKELQLALLRGDISQAEHDRRRARYAPPGEELRRAVSIPEALARGYPILDPLGNRLHYPGDEQYEAWRKEHRKVSKFGQWLGRWMKH